MFNKSFQITFCIPVYGTEGSLEKCLKSISLQNLKDVQVVVVNDASFGFDCEGKNCRQIVKAFKKSSRISTVYIEHTENKGLVEARRTAVNAAKGKYIFNLDSDDFLEPDSVHFLIEKAESENLQIVQGGSKVFISSEQTKSHIKEGMLEQYLSDMEKKVNLRYDGILSGKQILNGYLVNVNHNGFLWGKLFERELYLEALNMIPPVYCTMAEDILQYFYLSLFAKSYGSVPQIVYNYSLDGGITSGKNIEDLPSFEKVCSAASVFTSLFMTFEENPELAESIPDDVLVCLRKKISFYARNNKEQLKRVRPELREQAYEILCDYWGRDLIEALE